jgi:hypothetical protein
VLSDDIPWSRWSRAVDIAGAYGSMLASVMQAHPHIQGTLFDQPQVITYVLAPRTLSQVLHHSSVMHAHPHTQEGHSVTSLQVNAHVLAPNPVPYRVTWSSLLTYSLAWFSPHKALGQRHGEHSRQCLLGLVMWVHAHRVRLVQSCGCIFIGKGHSSDQPAATACLLCSACAMGVRPLCSRANPEQAYNITSNGQS